MLKTKTDRALTQGHNRRQRLFSVLKIAAFSLLIFSTTAHSAKKTSSTTAISPTEAEVFRAEFETAARAIPTALIEEQRTQIGDVDLNELLNQMKFVTVSPVSDVEHIEGPNGCSGFLRRSGEWKREDGKMSIAVSFSRWNRSPKVLRPLLALHEFFGSLGYGFDERYECSGPLEILSEQQTLRSLSQYELKTAFEMAAGKCRLPRFPFGGSTGITGGGDFSSVMAKWLIMHDTVRKIPLAPTGDERNDAFSNFMMMFDSSMFVEPFVQRSCP